MACVTCGIPAANTCAKCKANYCSSACQSQDWAKHKGVCRMIAQIKQALQYIGNDGPKKRKRKSSGSSFYEDEEEIPMWKVFEQKMLFEYGEWDDIPADKRAKIDKYRPRYENIVEWVTTNSKDMLIRTLDYMSPKDAFALAASNLRIFEELHRIGALNDAYEKQFKEMPFGVFDVLDDAPMEMIEWFFVDMMNVANLEWNKVKMVLKLAYKLDRVWRVVSRKIKHPNVTAETIKWASGFGHAGVVELLLDDDRVDPAAMNNAAIKYASERGHAEVVELLLADPRVDPAASNNEAIREASENGHIEVVRLLLGRDDVDPTADDNEAIREASMNGHTEVVKLLLEQDGVDPTADDNESIKYASERGHAEVVKLLLEWKGPDDERVDPAAADNEAIRRASLKGRAKVVKLLLADSRVVSKLSWGDVI